MYSVNRMGPRTEPCGIPDLNGMGADLQPSDRVFPMTTDWVLLVRYEQNHSSDLLDTAKCCWSHWRSVEWSMVSNTAERTRRIKQATSW